MRRKGQDIMDWKMPVPRKLDKSKCALFDDFPYISIQEKVLKAQAAGQFHDEYIRGLYSQKSYDVDDPEQMATNLDDAENGADAITAYRAFFSRRLARDRALADYRRLHSKKQSEHSKQPEKQVEKEQQ